MLFRSDEVFDGVVREEGFELLVELRGERLIVAEDECGPSGLGDYVGYGERLSRARDTEEDLAAVSGLDTVDELSDGLRLVSRRLVLRNEFEFGHCAFYIKAWRPEAL